MLLPVEKETLITVQYHANTVEIYTSDPQMMRRLDKRCRSFPNVYRVTEESHDAQGNLDSKTYQMPRKLLRFGAPRQYTAEQREQMRQRGQQAYQKYLRYSHSNQKEKKGDS